MADENLEYLQRRIEELENTNDRLRIRNTALEGEVEHLDEAGCDCDSLLEGGGVPSILLDEDLKITKFTEAARQFPGMEDEHLGQNIRDLPISTLNDDVLNLLDTVVRTSQPGEVEIRRRKPVSDHILRILPCGNKNTGKTSICLTFLDVSRLKQVQRGHERLLEEINTILDTIPGGVGVSFDPESRKVHLNKTGMELIGSSRENASRAGYGYEIKPEGEPWLIQDTNGNEIAVPDFPLQTAARTGKKMHDVEMKIIFPNGDHRFIKSSASPLFDEEGNVRGAVSAFHDVTEARRVLEQREHVTNQQALLARIIFEAYQQDSLSQTLALTTEECARALGADFAKILEYRPEEGNFILRSNHNFEGATVDESIIPSGSRSLAGFTLASDEPVLVENLREDPRFQELELLRHNNVGSGISALIPGSNGEPYGVIGVHSRNPRKWTKSDAEFLKDLAVLLAVAVEKEQRMEQVRRSEEHFREMTEVLPQMVFVAEPAGYALWINKRWEEYSGENLEGLLGTGWKKLVHPQDLPSVEKACAHSQATGEVFEVEYRMRRHDGQYRWHLVRAVAIHDSHGPKSQWFGSATDIEDRKRVENELRELDRRKDQFLAMLGHELRNPLAAVRNSIFVVRQQPSTPDQQDECLEIIERQANNLGRLVDDLLDITRINSGRVELNREHIDWRTVIESIGKDYGSFLQDKQLELKIELPDEPMLVDGDPVRLSQALGNLLHNACKFSESHQRINLIATINHEERTAEVLIRDYGKGMGEDTVENLFQSFPSRKKIYRAGQAGLGLGLVVVKKLIEMHGGRIMAESHGEGKGAEFRLILPLLSRSETAPVLPDSDLSQVDGGNGDIASNPENHKPEQRPTRRVMLVEDDDSTSRSLSLLLLLENQHVRVAPSYREAVRLATDWRPEVVICDIQLPDGNGLELVTCLRNEHGLTKTRYVALSGFSTSSIQDQANANGFDAYLVKPPAQEALMEACFGSA